MKRSHTENMNKSIHRRLNDIYGVKACVRCEILELKKREIIYPAKDSLKKSMSVYQDKNTFNASVLADRKYVSYVSDHVRSGVGVIYTNSDLRRRLTFNGVSIHPDVLSEVESKCKMGRIFDYSAIALATMFSKKSLRLLLEKHDNTLLTMLALANTTVEETRLVHFKEEYVMRAIKKIDQVYSLNRSFSYYQSLADRLDYYIGYTRALTPLKSRVYNCEIFGAKEYDTSLYLTLRDSVSGEQGSMELRDIFNFKPKSFRSASFSENIFDKRALFLNVLGSNINTADKLSVFQTINNNFGLFSYPYSDFLKFIESVDQEPEISIELLYKMVMGSSTGKKFNRRGIIIPVAKEINHTWLF